MSARKSPKRGATHCSESGTFKLSGGGPRSSLLFLLVLPLICFDVGCAHVLLPPPPRVWDTWLKSRQIFSAKLQAFGCRDPKDERRLALFHTAP